MPVLQIEACVDFREGCAMMLRKLLWGLCLGCLSFLSLQDVGGEEPLFIYKSGTSYGFINAMGHVVIDAQYVGVKEFQEGLAAVNVNDDMSLGQWGYIDPLGNMVIEPQYWLASSFSEGLAAVLPTGGVNWSYIDATGKVLISRLTEKKPFIYGAQPFKNGVACVEAAKDRTAFKRTEGFQSKKRTGQKGMWGFVDALGRVIALDFDHAMSFVDGLAVVEKDGKIGYVTPDGVFAIVPQFEKASSFSEGLACVQIKNKYGYINTSGKFVIEPIYDLGGSFSEGFARVKTKGKYGFVDATGNMVIAPVYDRALGFSEGFAVVVQNGKYGHLDRSGKMLADQVFDFAQDFSEGLAAVKVGDKWGYVDEMGNMVIEPQFDLIASFHEGLARVGWGRSWADAKWGYVDRMGKLVYRE
ncbi:MAG: WG repeat-containing protein [Candidatus Latescibacterota bacterium]